MLHKRKLTVGPGAPQLQTRFPKTILKYGAAVDFVASEVGPFGVGSLERMATALLVQTELPDAGIEEQAARLHAYKGIDILDSPEERRREARSVARLPGRESALLVVWIGDDVTGLQRVQHSHPL